MKNEKVETVTDDKDKEAQRVMLDLALKEVIRPNRHERRRLAKLRRLEKKHEGRLTGGVN